MNLCDEKLLLKNTQIIQAPFLLVPSVLTTLLIKKLFSNTSLVLQHSKKVSKPLHALFI